MRKPFAFVLTAALALCATLAQAQDTPLRIVVGYAPGGATDRVARIVADKLGTKLGTPVIVENKTGAGGRLSAQAVKAAPANQPTLLLANPAVMLVAPLVFPDAGYDPERDFRPVSHVNSYEFGVAVGSAVPVKELPHLMAWLKANPDKANFGVPATGSLPHFFGLMVGDAAKVRAEVVGYRGSAPCSTTCWAARCPWRSIRLTPCCPSTRRARSASWPCRAPSAARWHPRFLRSRKPAWTWPPLAGTPSSRP